MSDLISILMPVKNTDPFLQECIDSIINQTYTNWELIAINDHSTDSSLEILKAFEFQDSRIQVYTNQGEGILAALQMAYEQSCGAFISRMDSDDINALHKYESMLRHLQNAGKGHVALGQVKYFSADGVGDGFQKYEQWLNGLISKGNCFDEIYKECVIPSPAWMLHRDDIDRIGGICTELIPEDYDLCFRMYKNGIRCLPSDDVILHWRDSPNRTSRTHEDYTETTMLAVKCYYFLDIDYKAENNLVVWGGGKRGKYIAKYLVRRDIPFTWVCNNKNKIGHEIYGVVLQSVENLGAIENKQIVISVANRDERLAISEECTSEDWECYFFC